MVSPSFEPPHDASAHTTLQWALDTFPGRIAYACSFGIEGMVLIDMLSRFESPPRIVTIDTGRLPQETHSLMQLARDRYGLTVEIHVPDTAAVQELATLRGPNSFYQSIEARKDCCHVRKVEPLERALRGVDAWISGLRRDQTPTRADIRIIQPDTRRPHLTKIMPLADWSWDDVWQYVRLHDVPYNPLHDRGYPSVGCAPCTRAVAPGEDHRAGRWWWERDESKECGLHAPPAVARSVTGSSTFA